jgi:radical SAM protein with 4Fe4S-binding SPASM domain
MREIQYKKFSWYTHKKNWRINKPNVCQFELTFNCGLHCRHCYSDCYNKPSYLKKELNTEQVKFILDKAYKAGIIWFCFTGGDPLTRRDFLDIYSYAKDKGFIVTVFSNAYSMSEEIVEYFKKRSPFVIEITLNAVTQELYEKISYVKGSFSKVMQGIDLILKACLPLKIKTQITKDNLEELARIKKFIEERGLVFRPSFDLHARLNGDLAPCNLRISPCRVLNLDGKVKSDCINEPIKDLPTKKSGSRQNVGKTSKIKNQTPNTVLFRCAIGGGDGFNIDPYGNTFPCTCIREPRVNLLKEDIEKAQKMVLDWVRSRTFTTDSKCKTCLIRESCFNCPGKAILEKGSLGTPIEWFCELGHLVASYAEAKKEV